MRGIKPHALRAIFSLSKIVQEDFFLVSISFIFIASDIMPSHRHAPKALLFNSFTLVQYELEPKSEN